MRRHALAPELPLEGITGRTTFTDFHQRTKEKSSLGTLAEQVATVESV